MYEHLCDVSDQTNNTFAYGGDDQNNEEWSEPPESLDVRDDRLPEQVRPFNIHLAPSGLNDTRSI